MKKKILIWIAAVLLCVMSACGMGNNLSGSTESAEKDRSISEGETLKVHFIDVGQGDATLILQGSHAMLIDAGNNDKGTAVQAYLKSQNVEHLDYVIGTHPDADHIGGLDVILYKFDWEKVLMPDVEKDTRTFQDVQQVIKEKNAKVTVPARGDSYRLGEAEFTVVTPGNSDYGGNANEYSIGIRLTFGENHFLFTGDAEEEAEQDMLKSGLDLSADVFKAAHHGSDTANTEEFLDRVEPEAVVISCGENNSYGHPRAAVMNELGERDISVYRTDEQGTIVASSDGEHITWNCGPSESQKAGEPQGSSQKKEQSGKKEGDKGTKETQRIEENEENEEEAYILNQNTRKFHKESCSSVRKMSEENRGKSKKSREELISEGYEPCKNCNP